MQCFMKIFSRVLKLYSGNDFHRKHFKGHNSVKKCRWSYSSFTAHRLMVTYICTNIHENILDGIKVIERTRFSLEKFQRGIIP